MKMRYQTPTYGVEHSKKDMTVTKAVTELVAFMRQKNAPNTYDIKVSVQHGDKGLSTITASCEVEYNSDEIEQ